MRMHFLVTQVYAPKLKKRKNERIRRATRAKTIIILRRVRLDNLFLTELTFVRMFVSCIDIRWSNGALGFSLANGD